MLQRVNAKTEDIIKERCAQWKKTHQPTHTVPFRSGTKHLPVIEMDLRTVFLNPESRKETQDNDVKMGVNVQ